MIGGQFNTKPGMGSGAQAPLPSGGMQGGSATLQQNIQQRVPNQGQFNGNPRGVYNTNFRGQGNAPSYMQQTNLGRYVPPTMSDGGRFGYNSNQWNNFGGYDYNLPGSYGSPQGGGQFAPMPGQFAQYMNPNMLSGNTFGFGNPFGQGMQQQDFHSTLGRGALGGWQPGQGGGLSGGDLYQQMQQQFYGGMGQAYFGGGSPYQGGRGGGNGTPSYDEWRGGFSTDMMMRSPEESAAREADFRRMYDEQFGSGSPSQGGRMGGNNDMPPGKDGRPLQTGFAPMPGPRAPRDNRAGPMMEDIPAYDRPENRSYNMNALYQMMGGF